MKAPVPGQLAEERAHVVGLHVQRRADLTDTDARLGADETEHLDLRERTSSLPGRRPLSLAEGAMQGPDKTDQLIWQLLRDRKADNRRLWLYI
jgi:hypothetical protein